MAKPATGTDKKLSPQAMRALEEAEIRRSQRAAERIERPKEVKGRKGPEPTRFGDWETKGIISDF